MIIFNNVLRLQQEGRQKYRSENGIKRKLAKNFNQQGLKTKKSS